MSRYCAERTLSSPVLKTKFSSSKATLHDCSTPKATTTEWIYVISWRNALNSAHLDWQTPPLLQEKKDRKRLSLNNLPPLDCEHACDIQKPTTFLVQTGWNFGSIHTLMIWYSHFAVQSKYTAREGGDNKSCRNVPTNSTLLGNCPIRLLSARIACRSLPHSHSCKLFNILYFTKEHLAYNIDTWHDSDNVTKHEDHGHQDNLDA